MKKKVVITGMGVISPIGNSVDEFWESLLQGKSGADFITHFDASDFDTKFAAEIKNFDATNYLDRKEARRMDLFTQYAMAAASEAIADSELPLDKIDLERTGVLLGTGIGGMQVYHRETQNLLNHGPRKISPFFIPMMIPDIAPGHISIKYGFKGPNFTTVSACASSAHSLGTALRLIRYGDADIMIAGGTEGTITPICIGGFNSLRALSTRNDDPQKASRPFDVDRDGFVVGEGSGILVLETEEHALKRGAKIYAEIAGAGATGDAYHITAPSPDGNGAIRVMKQALNDADVTPGDVDYVNAHGTSTPHNDRTETTAIKAVFGDHAKKLSINSTKSMIGHLLGASGSLELIATVKSILENKIHPTINYQTPDPDCDLNYTPNNAIEKTVNVAISNSFGFGGHNGCIVVKRYQK
ncbi:beta-ketoacyl-[acyl-carrier-protein] synthase II [candidate division KSB1 bacterium 4572_119]|nr:MAG: beta-ketoacyl-[acyl-carrier-protein] synthase II [candidate division KSB1 bacterium 4572_119]